MGTSAIKPLRMAVLLVACTGCAYSIHQYNAGDISVDVEQLKSAKHIEVETKKNYILAKFDNDFVDSAYQELASQCMGGQIVGVTSRYITDLSFFSFTEHLDLEGYCIASK